MADPKWDAVLAQWALLVPAERRAWVVRGVPARLRGALWQRMRLSERDTTCDELAELLARPCDDESTIARDVPRVYPEHSFFRELNGAGQTALFQLLKAYAQTDPVTGYCQGLGYVAGALLLYLPVPQALDVLCFLLKGHKLDCIFASDLAGLRLLTFQFDRLLEQYSPVAAKHFCAQGVQTSSFTAKWFSTIFAYRLPHRYVCRILDLVLLDGPPALLAVALTIVQVTLEDSKTQLLRMTFEELMAYFGGFPECIRRIEPAALVSRSLQCDITEAQLRRLERDFSDTNCA